MAIPDPSTPTLPRVFPLAEAARRMGVTEAALKNMIQSGQIPAFQAPDGQMLVPMTTEKPSASLPVAVADDDINARLAAIKREDFEELEGVPITVSEAAKKYGVSPYTIQTWKRRYPHVVQVLSRGQGRRGAEINEADIAYLVAIYQVRKQFGILSGTSLVDAEGNPTLIKHPELALYRRRKRLKKQSL